MNELPDGWVWTNIGDITSDALQRQPNADEQFKYIDISSVDRFSKRVTNPQMLYGHDAPSRARKIVATGDVLVSMTRPNLNAVAMISSDLDQQIASTGFDVLRPLQIEPKWLFYLVRSDDFVSAMSDLVQGALYPAVRPRDIRSYIVPLAPLNEQQRIVDQLESVLARIDGCRERLDRIPELIKRFRQTVLASATSGELTAEWRGGRQEIYAWQLTDIQSVSIVSTGSTPLRSDLSFYAQTGTPWITSAATHKEFITEAQEFVTDKAISTHRLKLFPFGTLLVAMYGEGKTRGQVSELKIEATINQACAAIIVNEERANRTFVKLVLQANYLEMRELAEGGNQPNLNLTKIKDFQLLLPPLNEQDEIVKRVDVLFTFANRLDARLEAAQDTIKRVIANVMSKAFRGELVPQDPNDEPASVLLERIQHARAEQQRIPRAPSTKRTKVVAKTLQEIAPTHLTDTLLENGGKLTPEELLRLSELTLDDFYTQIKSEMKSIRDVRPDEQTRFLEAIS